MVSEMSDLSISNNDRSSHTKLITLPTILTLGCVASIPLLVANFYMDGWQGTALTTCIFIAATITDWLDGYIAHKMKLKSSFGAFLDLVADKLMVSATLILLCTRPVKVAALAHAPWLLIIPSIIIISREVDSGVLFIDDMAARSSRCVSIAYKSYELDQTPYNEEDLNQWSLPFLLAIVGIKGYPGKYYCPRMNSMNKLAYAAICTHSPTKPILIFVSSRRQTRLIELDLIQFAASDERSRQFLNMPEKALQMVLSQVSDQDLRHTLQFGIDLHHAGLYGKDKSFVEELFANNKIQVLVCTITLAWGVNLPAHLVITKVI